MKKLVFDMDNTLADFDITEPNALKRFQTEKDFFTNLKQLNNNATLVNQMIAKGIKCYILSASPNEQADKDKIKWLKKHIPNLKRHQIVFCRLGENKAKYIKDLKNAVLIDDYTTNLLKWVASGGKAIKYLNGINGINGTSAKNGIASISDVRDIIELL